jgi:hypothetical protein
MCTLSLIQWLSLLVSRSVSVIFSAKDASAKSRHFVAADTPQEMMHTREMRMIGDFSIADYL